MRILRFINPHMVGTDVTSWQNFLTTRGYSLGRVDGDFGQRTHNATVAFQRRNNLEPDGIVGRRTREAAQRAGFVVPAADPRASRPTGGDGVGTGGGGQAEVGSTTWPPRPANLPAPSLSRAQRLFGAFSYVHAPTASDKRTIRITDGWDTRNIITVHIPQLVGVNVYGTPSRGNIRVHRLAANQIKRLFKAWEDAKLTHLIKSYSGAFTPRFIGGTRTLSNHAFGAAFDINEAWNGQPRTPTGYGRTGSVRELVPIANDLGFYWGGHYRSRPDGMHFEVVELK